MKRLNYLILGAAALTMASCSQDDIMNSNQGDGNFAITVKLPADLGTRAEQNQGVGYYGQGYEATQLLYAVYETDAQGNVIEDAGFPVTTGNATFDPQKLETTVYFNLANGKYYNIAFFAESVTAQTDGVYDFNTSTGVLTVKYENMTSHGTNEDAYDCYYKLHETGKIGDTGSLSQTVTLTRPVAQINWGTSDYDAPAITDKNAFGDDPASSLQTTFTAELYTTFNLFNREVGNPTTVTLGTPDAFAVPSEEGFPVTGYDYVAMQYVLAPVESAIVDLNLTISSSTGTYNDAVVVNSAPYQANYRTNIYGSLLTDDVDITVVKDPIWGTPDYDIVEDGQSLLAGLQAGNNVMLNKDITFSQYVKIDKPVTLDLNGHNITWNKAEDGAFYVVEGGNLTISGQGTITASEDEYATLVWVDGGEATIHNGTFVGSGEGQLIYCQKGTITIYGGTYNLIGTELNKVYFYPINCRDQEYDDDLANIIVKGGIYYNFNPANNPAEGANTNFVADGYQSSEVTMANGETAWAVVPNGYSPAVQANQTILRTGGKVALAEDYNYVGSSDQAYLMINQNTEINLNGYTLSSSRNGAYNATLTVGGSGVQNVTISNGTILPLSDPASDEPALIFVRPVNNVQVTLNDITAIGMHPVWMNASNGGQDSKITINSGTYNSQSATSPAVYVSAYNGVNDAGQIVINGGTFGQAGITNPYLLNVLDRLRTDKDPREFIIVYGGTFINFNPADCVSEGVPTNFVAEGYTVISKKVGNDTYYTVVKAN